MNTINHSNDHYHILWVTKENEILEVGHEFYATELAARRVGDLSKRLYMIQSCNKACKLKEK